METFEHVFMMAIYHSSTLKLLFLNQILYHATDVRGGFGPVFILQSNLPQTLLGLKEKKLLSEELLMLFGSLASMTAAQGSR